MFKIDMSYIIGRGHSVFVTWHLAKEAFARDRQQLGHDGIILEQFCNAKDLGVALVSHDTNCCLWKPHKATQTKLAVYRHLPHFGCFHGDQEKLGKQPLKLTKFLSIRKITSENLAPIPIMCGHTDLNIEYWPPYTQIIVV
jgi:hypothetical protein